MAVRDQQLERAKKWLKECRKGEVQYFAKMLANFLNSEKIAPEQIGSTAEEISYLLQAAYLVWAKHYLNQCRRGMAGSVFEFINCIYFGGFSYKELGTSEREVAEFQHAERVNMARLCIKQCRRGAFGELSLLQSIIQDQGVKPEEIDATSEEIAEFERLSRQGTILQEFRKSLS